MVNFSYHVYEDVYESMKKGTKRIEIRLYNEKSSRIKIGDIIKFSVLNNEEKYIMVRVTDLIIYKDVNDLVKRYNFNMSTKTYNKENIIEVLYKIFGKEKVDTHKFIGISFELVK